MPSDLLLIGKSGARAAQAGLAVAAQNVANAGDPDYARRRVEVSELAATGGINVFRASRLSGVLVDGIARSEAHWLSAEARRTGAGLAGADVRIDALKGAERALELSGLAEAHARFAGELTALQADPLSDPRRAVAGESARQLAASFNLAASELAAVGDGVTAQATDGVDRVNRLAADLAAINFNIVRTPAGSAASAMLADRRDAAMRDLAELTGAEGSVDRRGRAFMALPGRPDAPLIEQGTARALDLAVAPDGRLSFALDGDPAAPAAGSLAGLAQAADRIADLRADLDAQAADLAQRTSAAQANGIAPDGTPGAPLLSGTTAADLAATGNPLATAPSGAAANSRDAGNLAALAGAVDAGADRFDTALSRLSAIIAGDALTREALEAIALSAASSLEQETAVDLDAEAANLLRFQQAFQASARVIQAATDIFDSMLAIR